MFWSDPNLYGATLPYKEINPMQQPFVGQWYNVPRYIPNLGYTPFGTTPHPFLRPETFTPFMNLPFHRPEMLGPPFMNVPFHRPETLTPFMNVPFVRPETVTPFVNPTLQTLGWIPPVYNWIRPY